MKQGKETLDYLDQPKNCNKSSHLRMQVVQSTKRFNQLFLIIKKYSIDMIKKFMNFYALKDVNRY